LPGKNRTGMALPLPGRVVQVFIQGREDKKPPDSIISPCAGTLCAIAHIRGKLFL